MDKQTYEQLMSKLDSTIANIQTAHPILNVPAEEKSSNGFIITDKTNIYALKKEHVPLVHTMLHMFYSNKGAKDLSITTIERLHKDIVTRLDKHSQYDKLDQVN